MIEGHSLAPVFCKRKEFADERELRAVIDVFPEADSRREGSKPLRAGNEIEVELRDWSTELSFRRPLPQLL